MFDAGKGPKITFASMSDDFMDARFDPEYKRVFQEKIEAFDAQSIGKTFDIPVRFFGEFEEKSQTAIKNLVQQIFHYAQLYDLGLEFSKPEVHFYTPTGWEFKKRERPPLESLPAAKIRWDDVTPFVEIVIPEVIRTSEAVIKTVRLLCSKLFGKLFFDEHVPKKEPYRSLPEEVQPDHFDLEEKAHLLRIRDHFSPEIRAAFEKTARSLMLRGPQVKELGKKEFFRFLDQPNIKVPYDHKQLIEREFASLMEQVKRNPMAIYYEMSERLFQVIPQSNLILPHEIKNFRYLKEAKQWMLFHAFEERVRIVVNTYRELTECRAFLEEVTATNPPDDRLLVLWKTTLKERMTFLKKRGLIKEFLIEGAKLTDRQLQKRAAFPLWIWQQELFKELPQGVTPKIGVKRITDQYKNSVFHKLFEAAHRMNRILSEMWKAPAPAASIEGFSKLKLLFSWLDVRMGVVEDMLHACRVTAQLKTLTEPQKVSKQDVLDTYERGWSYFVSFALIHRYYIGVEKRRKKQDPMGEKFLQLIESYILKRVQTQPAFRIAELMMKIYRDKEFDLREITSLIREEAQTLDFFVLNQDHLFARKKGDVPQIIDHYSESLQQWKMERYKNRLTPPPHREKKGLSIRAK